jgi:hypothetical protein
MTKETPEQIQLRSKVGRVLTTGACSLIRFRLANIYIGPFMYNYIAGVIMNGDSNPKLKINLRIDSDRGYDHATNTLILNDGCPDAAFVHESTHALINATHKGQTIWRKNHEAAAYLAEAIWSKNPGKEPAIDAISLRNRCLGVADNVIAWNKGNPSQAYVCTPGDIIRIYGGLDARGFGDLSSMDVQTGIGGL